MEIPEASADELYARQFPEQSVPMNPDVRRFLDNVLALRAGNIDSAADWLSSPNNALQSRAPVDMIRNGQMEELQRFWDHFAEIHDR